MGPKRWTTMGTEGMGEHARPSSSVDFICRYHKDTKCVTQARRAHCQGVGQCWGEQFYRLNTEQQVAALELSGAKRQKYVTETVADETKKELLAVTRKQVATAMGQAQAQAGKYLEAERRAAEASSAAESAAATAAVAEAESRRARENECRTLEQLVEVDRRATSAAQVAESSVADAAAHKAEVRLAQEEAAAASSAALAARAEADAARAASSETEDPDFAMVLDSAETHCYLVELGRLRQRHEDMGRDVSEAARAELSGLIVQAQSCCRTADVSFLFALLSLGGHLERQARMERPAQVEHEENLPPAYALAACENVLIRVCNNVRERQECGVGYAAVRYEVDEQIFEGWRCEWGSKQASFLNELVEHCRTHSRYRQFAYNRGSFFDLLRFVGNAARHYAMYINRETGLSPARAMLWNCPELILVVKHVLVQVKKFDWKVGYGLADCDELLTACCDAEGVVGELRSTNQLNI